jgi:trehalose/maltose hydrolase-like predicted phosphorylase
MAATAAAAAQAVPSAGAYVLTQTTRPKTYAPTFTGNGFLGVRVPAVGQGYAGGTVPSQSELAGFYAKPNSITRASQGVQQRASIPTWSTLTFADGGTGFSLTAGHTSGWRQSIDLHTGVITTSATWTAPDGHVTGLSYQVLTDRADAHVGLVQLTLTPRWTGTATVTDEIDGTPATTASPVLTDQLGKGFDAASRSTYVSLQTQGTAIQAAIATQLGTSANVTGTPVEVDASAQQSVGQQLSFPVTAGQSYTITKYVGVDDSQDSSDPVTAAQAQAASAATTGFAALLIANTAAWAQLWAGRIDVLGDPTLGADVNASQFYLWSSTRAGVDWSVSPAGLSSNGYDGHIFWDAETWMFPSLLAQHPDLAAAMEAYRFNRLPEAQQHATATGAQGARFPWESALDGTEQIPPPVSINSEGLFEQHITADVALAQWQYYLATGDRTWLADEGWPVIAGAATFWASRAVRGAGGRYHIDHVTGPDEENPDVNDEVFTNVAAASTLRNAIAAAHVLGQSVPADWATIAARLVVPVNSAGVHPEFDGYQGQLVKQADVALLQYPWEEPMPRSVAQNDLAYYVPRTDPAGPSMSDAVNSIDSSTLQTTGCSSYVYTLRSYEPYIRDGFDQFSETSTGGAFTFMTGIGGFLQEFLYGYSGVRFDASAVRIAPSLTAQLPGIVLHDVSWQGRVFTIAINRTSTTVTMISGPPLPLRTPGGPRLVPAGRTSSVRTARPDLKRSADRVLCGSAGASSAAPGAPALAAVDGSAATDWSPVRLPATLTVPVAGRAPVRGATIVWGRQWPAVTTPNVHPRPKPVITRRATRYELLGSINGRSWSRLATVTLRSGTTDRLAFAARRLRDIRVRILSASDNQVPLLEELTVTG